jgi:predicted O-linked N-acetylglucosamine transferase (SPINDLY family)
VADAVQTEFAQGLAVHQQGKLAEAESIYRELLQQHPDHPDALHFLGVLQAQRQNLGEAERLIGRAIKIAPDNAAAHANRGNVLKALMRNEDALASYDRALGLDPESVEALINRGAVLLDLGRHEAALASYEAVLALRSDHREAQLKRCGVLTALRRFEDALTGYDRVLEAMPDDLEALFNRGVVLVALKRHADAVASYDRALAIKPDFVEVLNNRGLALWNDRRCEEAVADYDRALALRPGYADAHYNRGITLAYLKRWDEALASYDRAIVLNPDSAKVFINRGVVLADLQRQNEALASYDRALEINPGLTDALNNRGGIFRKMGLHERAAQDYLRLLELEPEYEHAAGNRLYSDLWTCNWKQFAESRARLFDAVRSGRSAALPFQVVVLSDSGAEQLQCARTYAARKYPVTPPLWTGERYRHDRIRIAYLSADFRDHATTHLMAELFERHDKSRFEVSAWSFGPDVRDAMRARLQKSFEQFNDVRNQSDAEVAALLRAQEIDIAVDLKGYSKGCRPAIFARRAAPIQINYLVYPGTTGAAYMDYIIADPEVIPRGHDDFYSEQVVRLPDSYQVNDSGRVISERIPGRAEAGLPNPGFVFCCFNNNYKITPEVFDVWMRLLQRVEGSVLWLLEDNAAASRNLRLEAEARGVRADRLVFAARMLPPDHLARHRLADLFLDTLPCNAHTTASDALWAGLPLLTCRGNAFPGRVAASLLRAIGLPELITETLADYEALALRLATTPALLADIKSRLARNRATHPLFDIDRYRRHIESAYVTMYERYQRGESPQSFSVRPME